MGGLEDILKGLSHFQNDHDFWERPVLSITKDISKDHLMYS